jgi:hypothetical protein
LLAKNNIALPALALLLQSRNTRIKPTANDESTPDALRQYTLRADRSCRYAADCGTSHGRKLFHHRHITQ